MNAVLALVGALLAGSSGVFAALVGKRRPEFADRLATGTLMLGAACGIAAAVRVLFSQRTAHWSHGWTIPGGAFSIRLDSIAAVFLIQIFSIGALAALYGLGYWPCSKHPDTTGRLRVFFGALVAGMALVVLANNAIVFLFGWEVMALSAFLALTVDDRSAETRSAGLVYLVATHIGTLAIMAAFALLRGATASYSLEFGALAGGTPLATAVFSLAMLGFGLKAGLMPLHVWLPGAHANAPTHVSAVMSGVMIKMGIYGLVRACSWFEHVPLWWGIVLFLFGSLSAVLGVAFALGQHDIKRLLAYHSVENIGIIIMSLGVAVIGRATSRPDLVTLGMAGALLHTFNHGLFKSLLFFGAGSVISVVHTRELDKMGGLAKPLPLTALAFLVGATAICGLPPLNGFISELFLYVGMLKGGVFGSGSIATLLVFGVPILALVGALAVACFAKVHGIVFLGEPRSDFGSDIPRTPAIMLMPMGVLVAACLVIGTAPVVVVAALDRAIAAWHPGTPLASVAMLIPFKSLMLANLVLLVAVVVLAWLLKLWMPVRRVARGPTWDCGYMAPTPRMQYTASSFADGLVSLFSTVLRPHERKPELTLPFPAKSHHESHVPEVVLDLAVLPVLRGFLRTAHWFRWIQPGSVHLYIVFILVTLVSMLFAWH